MRPGGEGVTQFGRALFALNISIMCGNSPQSKGRIERAFGTLKERMVQELRLFFFSSRRRHTRLTCDWSSDVYSSDLTESERDAAAGSRSLSVYSLPSPCTPWP